MKLTHRFLLILTCPAWMGTAVAEINGAITAPQVVVLPVFETSVKLLSSSGAPCQVRVIYHKGLMECPAIS